MSEKSETPSGDFENVVAELQLKGANIIEVSSRAEMPSYGWREVSIPGGSKKIGTVGRTVHRDTDGVIIAIRDVQEGGEGDYYVLKLS